MTPIWREVIKPLLSSGHGYPEGRLRVLAKARCFDLREVQGLLYATSTEMRRGASYAKADRGHSFTTDIGERVCLPAPICWLEWNDFAVLIDQESTGSACLVSWARYTEFPSGRKILRDEEGLGLGVLTLEDGIATVFRRDTKASERPPLSPDESGVQFSFLALAALALINSPAAKRERMPSHRGFERALRRSAAAPGRDVTHTRVTLALGARTEGDCRSGGATHPKAFHFCRAHTRQRSSGKVERVRAHWRGDPAFGVRLPTYKVAA